MELYVAASSTKNLRDSGLTIHSSRRHFVARLNSGVRPQLAIGFRVTVPRSETPWCSERLSASSRFSQARRASLSGSASDADGPLVANGQPPPGVRCRRFGQSGAGSRPTRPSDAASVTDREQSLSCSHFRRSLRPNNSFKPTPLRGSA